MEEFKKKTDDDLKALLAEKREGLRKFRFESAGARAKNTKEGRNLRVGIAHLMTELANRLKASKTN